MKFIKRLRGKESYRNLSEKTGVSHASIWNYETKNNPILRAFLTFVCLLRKVMGLSWEDYGNMLDKETKQ